MDTIEITIPSHPKYLKVVRCGIERLCQLSPLTKEETAGVIQAVNEAVTNIIRHAYENAPDKPISLRCRLLPDAMEMELHDFGKSTKPEHIRSRDLNEVRPGGLGVYIIQSNMDEVIYEPDPEEGNRLILKKFFSTGASNDER